MGIRYSGALTALALLSACAAAGAKNLYVDSATGNDSVSYANNSESAPWRTLGRATWGSTSPSSRSSTESARAGDVVIVRGGPFTAPASNDRFAPAFNPTNSGTASAPITFRATGRVELRTTGGTGPAMGAYERNYIRWEGNFYVNEQYVPPHSDTGPVTLALTTGSVIDGCEVQGRPITYIDNHNGVRVEYAHNSTVRNCLISGIQGTSGSDLMHHNKAGIMLYYSNDIVLENNEISNSGSGIFPKGGDNYNITVRYNRISGTRKGIRTSYSSSSQGQNRIYQNVILNGVESSLGIEIAENSYNWTVANNTIYGATDSSIYITPGSIGNLRVANNIVANAPTAFNSWENQMAVPGPGRNVYYNVQQWAAAGRTFSSITSWLSAAPGDAGSTFTNPNFVNAGAGDFKLASSSTVRSTGIDLLDLDRDGATSDAIAAGAYITGSERIGRNTGPTPNPPTALTVE